MADLATLARPYAKAVFELARGADAEAPARWSATLKLLSEVVAQPQVAALIDDPRLPRAVGAAIDLNHLVLCGRRRRSRDAAANRSVRAQQQQNRDRRQQDTAG